MKVCFCDTDNALRKNPHLPEAHLAFGMFHHREGEFIEAIRHFDQATFTGRELGKNETVAGWRLGHWAQDDENWHEAERCFRQAYDTDGGYYGYCLAVALNALGRHEEALPLVLAQAKEVQPDELSWFQVGFINEKLGRTADAVEAYRTALIINPDYALAMFDMAGSLWNSGEYDRAAIIFRTAAQQFPEHQLTTKLHSEFPELFPRYLVCNASNN